MAEPRSFSRKHCEEAIGACRRLAALPQHPMSAAFWRGMERVWAAAERCRVMPRRECLARIGLAREYFPGAVRDYQADDGKRDIITCGAFSWPAHVGTNA